MQKRCSESPFLSVKHLRHGDQFCPIPLPASRLQVNNIAKTAVPRKELEKLCPLRPAPGGATTPICTKQACLIIVIKIWTIEIRFWVEWNLWTHTQPKAGFIPSCIVVVRSLQNETIWIDVRGGILRTHPLALVLPLARGKKILQLRNAWINEACQLDERTKQRANTSLNFP